MPMDKTSGSVTGPQKYKLMKLTGERDLSQLAEEQRNWLAHPDNLNVLSMAKASEIITLMLKLPLLPTQPAELVNIRDSEVDNAQPANIPDAGYYFIVDTTVTPAREAFFRVQKGREGTKWHGYTFLAIQASDDFYAIKDPVRRQNIFDIIMQDPINAMNEYGIRLGRCGVCGRTLTDRDSRLRGIGPICASKLPATEDQVSLLADLGLLTTEA